MLSKAKWFKTYGVPKEKFANYTQIIQEGNDTSLGAITVIDTLIVGVYTVANYIGNWGLDLTIIFALLEALIAILFFIISAKIETHHYIFFYLTVEVLMVCGVYVMCRGTASTIFLYPAVAVLIPLFYMYNMFANILFFGLNYLVFVAVAWLGPDYFAYMRGYVGIAGFFTLIGMIIHYVYQSNRLRELINYQDSLEKRGALEITSSFDQLSKLLRRRAFVRVADYQIRNRDSDRFMMMGIIDIDHFKLINDTYGHQVGDETIAAIGRVVAEELDVALFAPESSKGFELDYEYDYGNIAGRLGGDEFIFLIKSVADISDSLNLMNDLIDTLNRTSIGNIETIEASVGIVPIEAATDTNFDEMYHKADVALYSAKSSGRNRCLVYKEGMRDNRKDTGIDSLTGLMNQEVFKEKAQSLVDAHRGTWSLIHIDIENFKSYNAKYGFKKGDELLIWVARSLEEIFGGDLISRFSEDHFVVLTAGEEVSGAVIDVKGLVSAGFPELINALRVGVYRIAEGSACDISIACDNAKMACDMLRGRYDKLLQYYDEKLEKQRDKFQYVVEHIDEAIEQGDIKVYFQPVIDVATRKAHSLEALARWDSREYGMLPPFDFIETLEKTRLIHKLDRYMVEAVCMGYVESKKHAGREFVPVSINLSQRDFEIVEDVVAMIDDTVAKYNMPRKQLHLEITESALTEQKEHLMYVSNQFEELGYQIWMDDFGSGYSSLNVLKDFKFDVIKFDMGFLRGNVATSEIILKHMVDMCKELGLKTLIEGVETEEQFEFIKNIGCDYCQGYLFSKPLPIEGIVDYLESEYNPLYKRQEEH